MPSDRRFRSRSRSRNRSPVKSSRRSRSPRRSQSPRRRRSERSPPRTKSDRRSSRQSPKYRKECRRQDSPPPKASSSRNFKPEASPPATLDDELLREKTVLTKKRSLVDRYERQDINVMCMHSKGKTIKTNSQVDEDDDSNDSFSPNDVIELMHEKTHISSEFKGLFERDEIKNFKEEPVETKVIRLMPTGDELKKLESKFGSTESKSRTNAGRRSPPRDPKKTSSLHREPERRRHRVTDDDLLNETPSDTSASKSRMDQHQEKRRPIQERLGSEAADRCKESRPSRQSDDLRHNLSRSKPSSRVEPVVRDYGHKSLSSGAKGKERTPDFSRRPDKGVVDHTSLDPTITPKGKYFTHDDRDERDFGRGGLRSGWRGGPRGGWRINNRYTPGYRGGHYGGRNRRDDRNNRDYKRKHEDFPWKHDKFDEIENELERKAEPSSTTIE